MRSVTDRWFAATCLVLLLTSTSVASSRAEPRRLALDVPTLGPFAFARFCVRYPADCRADNRTPDFLSSSSLPEARRRELLEVNRRVNAAIRPKRHTNDVTFDTWRVAPLAGDCNDYAVTKRHELLARGWPAHALLLAEVITPWGEHHLVLVVRNPEGDVVLDNLDATPKPWFRTTYAFVRAQSPSGSRLWSSIGPARQPRVASAV